MHTVLVLEDSEDDRALFEIAIAKAAVDRSKVTFEYLTDGGAAIGWLQVNAAPALIITDNNMSPVNGAAFVETIKSLRQFESIPVAMLTGHLSDPVIQGIRHDLVSLFDKNQGIAELAAWLGELVQRYT